MKKLTSAFCLAFAFCGALPLVAVAEMDHGTETIQANIAGPAIDFGLVSVGSSGQTVIGGKNNTPYTMYVYAALGGVDAGDFSMVNGCSGLPLLPGASCFGTVSFNPRSTGPKKAELIIVLRGEQNIPMFETSPPPDGPAEGMPGPMFTTNRVLHLETRALSGTGK